MAARKSCTKMTWAEAKAKCGEGGGSKNPNKATIKISQQPNHGKLLAAKILAKAGPSENERIKDRQALKTARKDQQRQEELDRRRELEKEKKKLDDLVRPCETAVIKRKEVENRFHEKLNNNDSNETDIDDNGNNDDECDADVICESKQLQLDEILALEAIYADTDLLRVSATSQLDLLQERLDEWQSDPDSNDTKTAVVNHPPLSYTLQRSIDDPDDENWVAHLLLYVVYPGKYPMEVTPPKITLIWSLVTTKSLVVSSNKPLESLGRLNQEELFEAMTNEAQESLLGMPSVYELLDTWLSEHIFEHFRKKEAP